MCKVNFSASMLRSVALSFANSSKQRKPANPNRHAVVSLTLDNAVFFSVSSTIAFKISTVIGAFFTVGLVSVLRRPSSIVLMKELADGEGRPTATFSHAKAWTISSAAVTDCDDSLICCRYNAKYFSSVGNELIECSDAHCFHLLKAPKYFLVVLLALLFSTVCGSKSANLLNSGSSSP